MGKKPAEKRKPATAAKEAAAEGSKRATELDKKLRGDIVFSPSNLDGDVLQVRYGYPWGREVSKGHGAPNVLAEGEEDPDDGEEQDDVRWS